MDSPARSGYTCAAGRQEGGPGCWREQGNVPGAALELRYSAVEEGPKRSLVRIQGWTRNPLVNHDLFPLGVEWARVASVPLVMAIVPTEDDTRVSHAIVKWSSRGRY